MTATERGKKTERLVQWRAKLRREDMTKEVFGRRPTVMYAIKKTPRKVGGGAGCYSNHPAGRHQSKKQLVY